LHVDDHVDDHDHVDDNEKAEVRIARKAGRLDIAPGVRQASPVLETREGGAMKRIPFVVVAALFAIAACKSPSAETPKASEPAGGATAEKAAPVFSVVLYGRRML